ncbi:MAG: hypothetical protein AB7I42_19740 [Bradyrhizobium sp.]|uniref:hypothetical protein n=1 Tax=Bradyrhizobium sp. TaxID=376 RepID=UPI003D0B8995
MKVHEENRNAVLLAAIMTTCAVVAGVSALFAPATANQKIASRPAYLGDSTLSDSTPVRIVGVPFIPNTNPRERY